MCDPCQRAEPDSRHLLSAEFYESDLVRAALAVYDFGVFFRVVRAEKDWSQQLLSDVLDLSQARISALERGVHRLRDVEIVARVCSRLGVPPMMLGFPDRRTTVHGGTLGRKGVSWVERRDFVQHVAGLALGIAGAAGVDVDRLFALLPQAEPTGTRHVGAADVEAIEQTTAAFVRQDFAYGGGLTRDAAVAQLRAVLPLLNGQVSGDVRPRLMVATARLAMQAGWMSFECQQHDAARRLWIIALDLARNIDHPQASDLTAYLLNNMGLQAVHLGRPKEALHLARIGETAAVGRHSVSASTNCCLADVEAQAYAAAGYEAECDRALGEAEEHFAVIDPASSPPYAAFLDEIHLASFQGGAHYTLALPSRDQRAARKAVQLLRQAVDGFGPSYTRSRASCLPDLAGAHALVGDIDTAVTIGCDAIDAVSAVHSPRAYDRLRVLNTVLEPLQHSAGVAELRGRLAVSGA
ncbi:MAG: helix-turn-helix domain-containing protein [Pseudonocardiaceae bacterium]